MKFWVITLSLAGAISTAAAGDRVYTADQTSNTVSVIDPATNKLLGSIHLGEDSCPEDANGKVWLTYNRPDYLQQRQDLPRDVNGFPCAAFCVSCQEKAEEGRAFRPTWARAA